MRKCLLTVVLPVFASLIMLQGCNKAPECPEVATVVYENVSSVDKGGILYLQHYGKHKRS